jgi:hypothetical protein
VWGVSRACRLNQTTPIHSQISTTGEEGKEKMDRKGKEGELYIETG